MHLQFRVNLTQYLLDCFIFNKRLIINLTTFDHTSPFLNNSIGILIQIGSRSNSNCSRSSTVFSNNIGSSHLFLF